MRHYFKTSGIALFLLVLSGCASSYLTNAYNQSGEQKSYSNILIVTKSKSQAIRQQFETQIADRLNSVGISALTSEAYVPQDMIDKKLSDEEIEDLTQKLISENIDGVLVTHLVDQEKYVDVIPGSYSRYPYYGGGYGRYWNHFPGYYWEPDRLVSGVNFFLESALYDISRQPEISLHWVGNFKLRDPGAIEGTSEKYASDLVTGLTDPEKGALIPVQ